MIKLSKKAMLCCTLPYAKNGVTQEDLEIFIETVENATKEYCVNAKTIHAELNGKLSKEFEFKDNKYYFSKPSKNDSIIQKGTLEFFEALVNDSISRYKAREILFTATFDFRKYCQEKENNNKKVLLKK